MSGFAASPPEWSADGAAKPTKMYVGGRIVKQKGLSQACHNWLGIFRHSSRQVRYNNGATGLTLVYFA